MDGSIAGCSSNVEIGGCDSDVENQSGGCSLYEAFEVPLETSDDSVCQSAEESLQRAFQKYRGKKQVGAIHHHRFINTGKNYYAVGRIESKCRKRNG